MMMTMMIAITMMVVRVVVVKKPKHHLKDYLTSLSSSSVMMTMTMTIVITMIVVEVVVVVLVLVVVVVVVVVRGQPATGFFGVSLRATRYYARIKDNGKEEGLGTYDTAKLISMHW